MDVCLRRLDRSTIPDILRVNWGEDMITLDGKPLYAVLVAAGSG